MFFISGLILAAFSLAIWLWIGIDSGNYESPCLAIVPAKAGRDLAKVKKPIGVESSGMGGGVVDEMAIGASNRQPLQFRCKAVETGAVLLVLAYGNQTVNERVRQIQRMRGISLSRAERESALSFLSGQHVPEGIGKGSLHWMADELLSTLRLQDPPQEDLAAGLAQVAFQRETDPVVRDYIMQHLGHLWEQYGSRKEIDDALWRAVDSSDETTPGTALIALSRGYERDGQGKSLEEIRRRAFELARNPATGLAVRVTALSIAGDGGGREVKELAADLAMNPDTPVILKRVAERATGK